MQTVYRVFGLLLFISPWWLVVGSFASPRTIAQTAKQITIKIIGNNFLQTGVLIAQANNTYWVLTCTNKNKTAISKAQFYTIDGQSHNAIVSRLRQFENSPLILIPFESPQTYETAMMGDSNQIAEGDRVYIGGFSQIRRHKKGNLTQFQFTEGLISSIISESDSHEFTHTSSTSIEMEGSPIFDSGGEVIGIHCADSLSIRESRSNNLMNWSIPINQFTEQARKEGINLGFSAFGSPPPPVRY